MNRWLGHLRAWWKKIFFWQSRKEGSQEFKPETHEDHALVLSVTESAKVPRWQQLRFFTRALSQEERRRFWISLLVAVVAFALGAGNLVRQSILIVPAEGGSVTEGLVGGPKLINPAFTPLNDVDRDLATLIYSGLFRLDENLQPQPDLVDHYTWKDNGKTLELVLRKDAFFHDGEALTAEDVTFTYQILKTWKSPLAKWFTGAHFSRIDAQTIRIQLDKADPGFLNFLTIGILPAHLWEDVSGENAALAESNLKPVGSGPYQAVSFTRDSKGAVLAYHLRAFQQYYGTKPLIRDWTFRFYPDRLQAQNAIRGGQIDALAFLPWGDVQSIQNKNLHSLELELPQETVAFLNTKQTLLKDSQLRRALVQAIDKEDLAKLIGPHASPVSSPFPFLESTTGTLADLESARTILDSLGWKLVDGDPVRRFVPPTAPSKKGKPTPPVASVSSTPLVLTIDVPNQTDLLQVADWLKRRWSLIGIRVEVRSQDPETLLQKILSDRSYQVVLWNILLPENQDLTPFWSSVNATDQGFNLSNLQDRDVDLALENIKSATSTSALLQAQRVLSDVILSRQAALFLLRPAYAYLVSERIQGTSNEHISRPSERLRATADWYINTRWEWK